MTSSISIADAQVQAHAIATTRTRVQPGMLGASGSAEAGRKRAYAAWGQQRSAVLATGEFMQTGLYTAPYKQHS